MNTELLKLLQSATVIPVLVIEQLEDAVPLAKALSKGGLNVLEITLRTDIALAALKEIKQALPNLTVGTGTVIDSQSLEASLAAGADFLVSPGTTATLIDAAKANHANLLPGAATPSEALHLFEQGYSVQKFFPAEAAGGVAMLNSINGPLPQIIFCPTGGINIANASQYLACNNVACVGGSWMAKKSWIDAKDWQAIENASREATNL